MKPTKLSDLLMEVEFESEEYTTRVDLQEGRIVVVEQALLRLLEGNDEESMEALKDWEEKELEIARAIIEDSGERFVDPPDKFNFHEYRQMERFIGTIGDQRIAEQLWRAIKGKGAFRFFKDTAHRLGLLNSWYQYREDAMKEYVIGWAEAKNVPYVDDLKNKRNL